MRPHGARRGPLVALAALVLAVLIAQVASAGGSPEGGVGALQRQIDQLRAKVDRTAEAATKKKRKRGPRGRRGPAGPIGPIGPLGPKGDPGATKVVVRTQAKQIAGSGTDSVNVDCANGERAVGGGGGLPGFSDNGDGVVISRPLANGAIPNPGDVPNGWTVFVHNAGIGEDTAKVYAICASP